jgi:hypothetical protein
MDPGIAAALLPAGIAALKTQEAVGCHSEGRKSDAPAANSSRKRILPTKKSPSKDSDDSSEPEESDESTSEEECESKAVE